MRIRMLKTSAAPSGVMEAGKIYIVSEEMGRSLIAADAARPVDPPAKPETEDRAAPEAAALPRSGKRLFQKRGA